MAESVVTTIAKKKMVRARAEGLAIPKIAKIAFGDGAVGEGGDVITPNPDEPSLKHELLRKEIETCQEISETSYRYSCTLEKAELVEKSINEIALCDDNDDIVAIKAFFSKQKDDDMEMIFEIDDTF